MDGIIFLKTKIGDMEYRNMGFYFGKNRSFGIRVISRVVTFSPFFFGRIEQTHPTGEDHNDETTKY
jgi:hypothetical protein